MTQFILAYEHAGHTYTCRVDAPNWEAAERHLLALASTGRVFGEHVMDVSEVDAPDFRAAYLDAVSKHNRTLDELRSAVSCLARIYPYVKDKKVQHRKPLNGRIVTMHIGKEIDEAFDFIERRDEQEYLK